MGAAKDELVEVHFKVEGKTVHAPPGKNLSELAAEHDVTSIQLGCYTVRRCSVEIEISSLP